MIITITPNPALDVSGIVKSLVPNEKSYVFHEVRLPGGNGINAARIAHRLGAKVLTTGFLGGSAGEEISELLKTEKIPQMFIKIKERTRSNITVSLEKSCEQTRLSFPGPRIQSSEVSSLLSLLKSKSPSLVVVGGSLPPGFSTKLIRQIVRDNHDLNIPTFVDIPGKFLKEVLTSRPFLIKPNLTEFQEMSGTKVKSLNAVKNVAKKFSTKIPVQCISSVEGGTLFLTKDHAWFGKIPKVTVLSTVGAGDSMVGAMSYAFLKGNQKIDEENLERIFRFGLAAACATLTQPGLTMGSSKDIKKYLDKVYIEKLTW